jgi:predicted dehydrogenase
MVPFRRRTNLDSERERINVDDADMFMGEARNGALFSLQSSYVTVGNYPGIEARIFGENGAIQVRLVEEFGVIQTIHTATPDAVEFVQREIPERYFAPGARPDDHWSTAFYGNLVHDFCQEILDGGDTNQGDFAQSARVQEIINAVALSHRRRAWVDLPLSEDAQGGE